MENGDELLAKVLQPKPGDDRDIIANDLLRAFLTGFPLEKLRMLLKSTEPEVVKTGIWIASELGSRGKSLLNDVVPLLAHPLAWVRFHAIDCIVTYTTGSEGAAVAGAIALLRDEEGSVRRKATRLLMQASQDQLASALTYLERTRVRDDELIAGLEELIRSSEEASDRLLSSASPVLRKFGVACAVRVSSQDYSALRTAMASEDDEIRRLAEEEHSLRISDSNVDDS